MTAVQYVQYILDNNWTQSKPNRPNDILKPDIIPGGKDWQRRLRTTDIAEIVDGGPQSVEPAGLYWREETVETFVTVDIRTMDRNNVNTGTVDGRHRLFGERGAGSLNANESPDWGGLVGETLRILMAKRRGDKEFDLVNAFEVNDLTDTTKPNVYRAAVEVRLNQRAQTVAPT